MSLRAVLIVLLACAAAVTFPRRGFADDEEPDHADDGGDHGAADHAPDHPDSADRGAAPDRADDRAADGDAHDKDHPDAEHEDAEHEDAAHADAAHAVEHEDAAHEDAKHHDGGADHGGTVHAAIGATPGDADGDGEPDVDQDSDGDGVPDAKEDSDGDGIPDSQEDADGDGIDDAAEDSDLDGVPDNLQDSDGNGIPDVKEDRDGDGIPDILDDSDGDGVPDSEDIPGDVDGDGILDSEQEFDEDDPPTDPFDQDGDGVVSEEEARERAEFLQAFKHIPHKPDAQAVKMRKPDRALVPSLSLEKYRKLVKLAKGIVLEKMETKIQKKTAKKMRTFSLIVCGVSLLGIFLLLVPLVLAKKYPGQGKVLFKYSALAALTFIITVNLFGGVLFGLRSVQSGLARYTNPSIAIAEGTFETLDRDAEYFIVVGKELFGPSLEEMRKHPDQQPAELILANGQKIVKDAKVFLSIANLFKKIDFIFGVIPIVLTIVTLILFVLAIRPTLVAIIKMPAQVAAGATGVGKDIVKKSGLRVWGELRATMCTIGVLVVLTLISSAVLGVMVGPALKTLLTYFARSVSYLASVPDASSGLVFVALFGVILFLVFNLATVILSMAFFLGKSQKIFQQRFNDGTPLGTHQRFFKWGIPSVLLVQVFPMLFAFLATRLVEVINGNPGAETSAEVVSWTRFMLMAPLFLVLAFLVLFWAVRGVKAIKFLATYKVKVKVPPGVESTPEVPR